MPSIEVTLLRGLAGCPALHRATVEALGLGKTNSTAIVPDTQASLGMIHKVSYLLSWKRVEAAAPVGRRSRMAAANRNSQPASKSNRTSSTQSQSNEKAS